MELDAGCPTLLGGGVAASKGKVEIHGVFGVSYRRWPHPVPRLPPVQHVVMHVIARSAGTSLRGIRNFITKVGGPW